MVKRTLLVVLAHPDDESFGPGGTLAKYAAEGVDVHVCIATDGAAGSVEPEFEGVRDDLVQIRAQELNRAVALLGVRLHRLDYRDSGMKGDLANDHPKAFINADETEAIGRIVRLIRQHKVQVVITNDKTGGYFHPDHIRCFQIATAAFHAAGDANQYSEFGLNPHQPQRLYYTASPKWQLQIFIWLARLRGQDPTAFGRNKDIDLTRLGYSRESLHAHINYRRYWDVKKEASAAHASQGGGRRFRILPVWLQKRLLAKESFIRAHPPVADGFHEYDLFDGQQG